MDALVSRIEELAHTLSAPGGAVGVWRNRQPPKVHVFGVSNSHDGTPLSVDELLPSSALACPLLCIGVLHLCEKYGIDMRACLAPSLLAQFERWNLKKVPLRGLLDQLSWAPAREPVIGWLPMQTLLSRTVILSVLRGLIEQVAQTPFHIFMRERILLPLGMTQSWFCQEFSGRSKVTGETPPDVSIIRQTDSVTDVRWSVATEPTGCVTDIDTSATNLGVPTDLQGFSNEGVDTAPIMYTTFDDYCRFISLFMGVNTDVALTLPNDWRSLVATPRVQINKHIAAGTGWLFFPSGGKLIVSQYDQLGPATHFVLCEPSSGDAALLMVNAGCPLLCETLGMEFLGQIPEVIPWFFSPTDYILENGVPTRGLLGDGKPKFSFHAAALEGIYNFENEITHTNLQYPPQICISFRRGDLFTVHLPPPDINWTFLNFQNLIGPEECSWPCLRIRKDAWVSCYGVIHIEGEPTSDTSSLILGLAARYTRCDRRTRK